MGCDQCNNNMIMFSNMFSQEKEYWFNQLSGYLEMSGFEAMNISSNPFESEQIDFEIPMNIINRLEYISNGPELSRYVLLLSAIELVIYKYFGNDILIGMPSLEDKNTSNFVHNGENEKNNIRLNSRFFSLSTHVETCLLLSHKNS